MRDSGGTRVGTDRVAATRVHYRVGVPRPETHLVHVSLTVDDCDRDLELRLPVWVPGSYLIREFARHVQMIAASDVEGRTLPLRKTAKDAWIVDTGGCGSVRVDLEVYAHELTVRTSHADATHFFLNPGNLLPYVLGRDREPLDLRVDRPAGWSPECALAALGDPCWFLAEDYDELVDSPIHCGPDPVVRFTVRGVPHRLATWGRSNLDSGRLTADLTRLIEAQAALFGGDLPYARYLFILLTADQGRGGLEHRSSCAVLLPRFAFRPGAAYERALRLLSHEFFHTWNVKRIRSEVLGPFDYRAENYTRLLWAMEGITEYYSVLLLRRAGLMTAQGLLQLLSEWLSDLAQVPGRHVQSLDEASFDAWIKYYRPDEHSANATVSYYLKGGLASLLLDMEMRRRTGNRATLDDLMRLLWDRYGASGRGVPEDGYEALVGELAGGDWTGFFERTIRGTGELDCEPLKVAGLDLIWEADQGPSAWIGLTLRAEGGRTRIVTVRSDGPCWAAAVSPGDELLAIDGLRVDEGSLSDRLRDYAPGDQITLALFRRDELVQVPVILAERPRSRARLRQAPRATVRQRTVYENWMGSPWAETTRGARVEG
jgi:predicted metalloprotease with PDZ domain